MWKVLNATPVFLALCLSAGVTMAQQPTQAQRGRNPRQLSLRLLVELLRRHARRRRGSAMPASQFGAAVGSVPEREPICFSPYLYRARNIGERFFQ